MTTKLLFQVLVALVLALPSFVSAGEILFNEHAREMRKNPYYTYKEDELPSTRAETARRANLNLNVGLGYRWMSNEWDAVDEIPMYSVDVDMRWWKAPISLFFSLMTGEGDGHGQMDVDRGYMEEKPWLLDPNDPNYERYDKTHFTVYDVDASIQSSIDHQSCSPGDPDCTILGKLEAEVMELDFGLLWTIPAPQNLFLFAGAGGAFFRAEFGIPIVTDELKEDETGYGYFALAGAKWTYKMLNLGATARYSKGWLELWDKDFDPGGFSAFGFAGIHW